MKNEPTVGLARILWTLIVLGCTALAASLASCDSPDRNGPSVDGIEHARADEPHTGSGTTTTRTPETPTGSTSPAPSTAPLDQESSLHLLTTINRGEIEIANLARSRAMRPDVRELAQQMVTQHTEAQTSLDRWASSASVTPRPNEASATVQSDAQAVRTRLEGLPAADFDAAYVESQVTMHREALRLIDERVVPGATDPAYRALLTDIRTHVAQHLSHAQSLADGMPH
jgi:putative membrane protein